MAYSQALPFTLRRSSDTMSNTSVTTTTETAHGLLRLEGESLVIQWRLARKTDHVGAMNISSDEEFEAVQEVVVPLSGVAGALVRRGWLQWFTAPRIVLRASDLQAFEAVTGEDGLRLGHPAEIVLKLRRSDVLAAEEFAAELELAVAQRSFGDFGVSPAMPASEPNPPDRLPAPEGEHGTSTDGPEAAGSPE
jgi:hypothetical protein